MNEVAAIFGETEVGWLFPDAKQPKPIDLAAKLYEAGYGWMTFEADVAAHFEDGWVISTPDIFLLAREVSRWAPVEKIRDPWERFQRGKTDCWFIHLLAGDLFRVFEYCPYAKEWVAFERQGVVRFWRYKSIREKITTLANHGLKQRAFAGRNPEAGKGERQAPARNGKTSGDGGKAGGFGVEVNARAGDAGNAEDRAHSAASDANGV